MPKTENAFAFVIGGEGIFGGTAAGQNQVIVFNRADEIVTVANHGSQTLNFLLIAGEPIGEPVARHGPFVMNSKLELQQAVEDFQAGRMGVLTAQ